MDEKKVRYAIERKPKEMYTREEVCKMLKDMQIEVLKCQGFFVGHISQVWAVDHLLGEKLEALGGGGVQKEHDKDTGETRYVWES